MACPVLLVSASMDDENKPPISTMDVSWTNKLRAKLFGNSKIASLEGIRTSFLGFLEMFHCSAKMLLVFTSEFQFQLLLVSLCLSFRPHVHHWSTCSSSGSLTLGLLSTVPCLPGQKLWSYWLGCKRLWNSWGWRFKTWFKSYIGETWIHLHCLILHV